MEIIMTTGKGVGKTPLSAFDAALKDAGVHNYNLITLSSIVPPNTVIKQRKFTSPDSEYGHKLYVVKAEIRSREAGKYIGAALGWYQLEDGRGVFVEHEEEDETEGAVRENLAEDIRKSVSDLCRIRGFKIKMKDIKMQMCITKVTDSPASALVIAVYQSESWE